MAFALYMIGFLVFVAGLGWAAMVAGLQQFPVLIGAGLLLAVGIMMAVGRPRPSRARGRRD